jgi:putative intracellular protease/amidase
MAKKVLVVLTSHDQLGDTGRKTGFWLEELAAPYYTFKDAGVELTLTSPKGGRPPLDPKSDDPAAQTDATRRFRDDALANEQLANTVKLSEVSAGNYDAIFYPGGHGPLWDLVSDQSSIGLIEDFWSAEKPVSSVCHAPIVLMNARDSSGELIVKDRDVTGFTNSEEDGVGLTEIVPMLVEDTMLRLGAKYSKAGDWEVFTRQDGNLITGQNPASSEQVAELVLKAIGV